MKNYLFLMFLFVALSVFSQTNSCSTNITISSIPLTYSQVDGILQVLESYNVSIPATVSAYSISNVVVIKNTRTKNSTIFGTINIVNASGVSNIVPTTTVVSTPVCAFTALVTLTNGVTLRGINISQYNMDSTIKQLESLGVSSGIDINTTNLSKVTLSLIDSNFMATLNIKQ
jgi:hypothetical protein